MEDLDTFSVLKLANPFLSGFPPVLGPRLLAFPTEPPLTLFRFDADLLGTAADRTTSVCIRSVCATERLGLQDFDEQRLVQTPSAATGRRRLLGLRRQRGEMANPRSTPRQSQNGHIDHQLLFLPADPTELHEYRHSDVRENSKTPRPHSSNGLPIHARLKSSVFYLPTTSYHKIKSPKVRELNETNHE